MRNDVLQRVREPKQQVGRLPGGIPGKQVELNTGCLDGLAKQVERILKAERKEEFEAELSDLRPCFEGVTAVDHVIDLLGIYNSQLETIVIDEEKISACAANLRTYNPDISDNDLLAVVQIHENAHATHHLAGDPPDNYKEWVDFAGVPSVLLEILAQRFTYEECPKNSKLECAFEELEKTQPLAYRLWRLFKSVGKEALYWEIRQSPRRIIRILKALGLTVEDKANTVACDESKYKLLLEKAKQLPPLPTR
ncbi:MAG: hypothetical protein V2B18_22580, partial [Pseudomonadota bacterium]